MSIFLKIPFVFLLSFDTLIAILRFCNNKKDLIFIVDFYRTAVLRTLRTLGANADSEENSETGQELDLLSLAHLLNAISNSEVVHSQGDDEDNIRSTSEIKKRSNKNDSKRTQDMSRLAMRILKRNGQQTSRVAYRILKKRRNNAARIAMRVLKRDPESNKRFKNFNRVTRASPYSNIGGYFGGMSLGQVAHMPYGFSGMTYYPNTIEEPSDPVQKRADCPNCEDESTAAEDEEA